MDAIKQIFIFFKLHVLFAPFQNMLLRLSYLAEFSRWCRKHKNGIVGDIVFSYNYNRRYMLYECLLDRNKRNGRVDYLEFGVAEGASLRWWLEHNTCPESRFYGFDTFWGLPENWGKEKKGSFSTQGMLPNIDDSRCTVYKGLFQETVDVFLSQYKPGPIRVVHLDADLYSSTLYVLTKLAHRLKKGDVLIFDEFSAVTYEFRAFMDFTQSYMISYTVIAEQNGFQQVAIEIG